MTCTSRPPAPKRSRWPAGIRPTSQPAADRGVGTGVRRRHGQPAAVHGSVAPQARAGPRSAPLADHRTGHGLPLSAEPGTAPGDRVTLAHQGKGWPSQVRVPVGPPLGMVTAQMTLAAAWVIERPSGWLSLAGQPGQTALTRMPSRASSAASSRVSALSAAFDTLYAGEPPVITEIEPPSLLTFTILGRVLERSIGSSASITRQGPNRLTSTASATVPRSALLAVAHRSYMVDALFTSTSVRPNRFFTHSAMLATLTELSTSSWQATIRIPSGSSSFADSSPLRRSREH